MRPPSISLPPDDRPTTPLPSLAAAQPAPDNPRCVTATSTPLYWPAAGGPTVYRPELSYSVTDRPVQPLAPPRRRHAAPTRRWPWVTGGLAVLLVVIALTQSPTKSTPPTMAIGDPGPTTPTPTRSNTTPTSTAVAAPAAPARAPAVVIPALPRATPRHTVARAATPMPRLVVPTPATTPGPTAVPTPTTATQPSIPATDTSPGLNTTAIPRAALPTPLVTAPPPGATSTYYSNCAAARAAGAAPLRRGDPGYRPGLDRDGDGVACE
jgi:hypothetical protein